MSPGEWASEWGTDWSAQKASITPVVLQSVPARATVLSTELSFMPLQPTQDNSTLVAFVFNFVEPIDLPEGWANLCEAISPEGASNENPPIIQVFTATPASAGPPPWSFPWPGEYATIAWGGALYEIAGASKVSVSVQTGPGEEPGDTPTPIFVDTGALALDQPGLFIGALCALTYSGTPT